MLGSKVASESFSVEEKEEAGDTVGDDALFELPGRELVSISASPETEETAISELQSLSTSFSSSSTTDTSLLL